MDARSTHPRVMRRTISREPLQFIGDRAKAGAAAKMHPVRLPSFCSRSRSSGGRPTSLTNVDGCSIRSSTQSWTALSRRQIGPLCDFVLISPIGMSCLHLLSFLTRLGHRLRVCCRIRLECSTLARHPNTNRPFVCMAGSREFHTHERSSEREIGNSSAASRVSKTLAQF